MNFTDWESKGFCASFQRVAPKKIANAFGTVKCGEMKAFWNSLMPSNRIQPQKQNKKNMNLNRVKKMKSYCQHQDFEQNISL